MFFKRKNVWIIFAVLTVLWMIVIFSFSNATADQSSHTSEGLTQKIIAFFNPGIKQLSPVDQQEIVDSAHALIRKLAHVVNYAVLGILCAITVVTSQKVCKTSFGVFLSLLVCILYAASDEFHQTFIPGRSGEIRDVLIDTVGSLAGIAIVFVIHKLLKAKQRQ